MTVSWKKDVLGPWRPEVGDPQVGYISGADAISSLSAVLRWIEEHLQPLQARVSALEAGAPAGVDVRYLGTSTDLSTLPLVNRPGDLWAAASGEDAFLWDGGKWVTFPLKQVPMRYVGAYADAAAIPAGVAALPGGAKDGDFAAAAGHIWVLYGGTWQDAGVLTGSTAPPPATTGVTVAVQATGVAPTGVGTLGAVVVDTKSKESWIGTGATYAPLTWHPTVTHVTTTGDDPGTVTVTDPVEGDVFVNSSDGLSWAYDGTNWEPLVSGAAKVTATDKAGEDPATYTWVAGSKFVEGDRFINRADKLSWVYGKDPVSKALAWLKVPTENTAHVSTTAGEDPSTYTFTVPPKVGDIFVNRDDSKSWVMADDPAGGTTPIWEPLGSSNDLAIIGTDADRPKTPKEGQHVFNQARNTIDVWDKATSAWISVGDLPTYANIASLPSTAMEGDLAWVRSEATIYTMAVGATPGTLAWKRADQDVQDALDALQSGIEHGESVVAAIADPPSTPTDLIQGQPYIVLGTGTGDWAGHDNQLAEWDGTAWSFVTPNANEAHLVEATNQVIHWSGTAWNTIAAAVPLIVSADTGNRITAGGDGGAFLAAPVIVSADANNAITASATDGGAFMAAPASPFVEMSQAAYDALATKAPGTLYVITS